MRQRARVPRHARRSDSAPSPIAPIAAVAALVPLVAGCGAGEPADAAVAVAVDTVGGVERLTYPEAAAPALTWTVDTVGVIGDALGAEEYQFGSLSEDALAGDAAGHVLAVDAQASRVLEYGPDGRHVATYGRAGGGPGELRFPGGVSVGAGDTAWVADVMNRRVTGYPRDGGEPRVAPYPDGESFPGFHVEAIRGGFLQVKPAFRMDDAEEEPRERLVRLDRELRIVDTLWTAAPEPSDLMEIDMGGSSMMLSMRQQFAPSLRWRPLSDGSVVVADSADYLVRVVGPDGAVRRIIRREPPARATTEADREAVRRRILAEADSGGGLRIGGGSPDAAGQRRIAEQRVEHMTFADRVPRILDLQVDPADRIWVSVADDADPEEQGRIDVYDRGGRLLGELHDVPFPGAFTGSDRMLIVDEDELDVPRIVVLRVPEMAAGGEMAGSD